MKALQGDEFSSCEKSPVMAQLDLNKIDRTIGTITVPAASFQEDLVANPKLPASGRAKALMLRVTHHEDGTMTSDLIPTQSSPTYRMACTSLPLFSFSLCLLYPLYCALLSTLLSFGRWKPCPVCAGTVLDPLSWSSCAAQTATVPTVGILMLGSPYFELSWQYQIIRSATLRMLLPVPWKGEVALCVENSGSVSCWVHPECRDCSLLVFVLAVDEGCKDTHLKL